jgi:thymidylate kinase
VTAPPHPPRPGRFVVVGGPDGAGKSTLVDALMAAVDHARVDRYHHRFGLLPRRRASLQPPERLHVSPAYPRWLSVIKLLFLYLDHLLASGLRVGPAVRRGRWVILERGWWDVVVDPARYRVRGSARLARALGRLLPPPDLLLVLEAPAATILARKTELAPDELQRQLVAWRRVAEARQPSLILDSRRPVPELVLAVLVALGAADTTGAIEPGQRHG